MRLLSSFCFLLLLTACGGETATDPTGAPATAESTTSAPAADQTSAPAPSLTADDPTESLCFYREVPYQDGSGQKDRDVLRLTLLGGKVSGRYEYLPAEKDGRRGTITGTYEGNKVRAKYRFAQEGTTDVAEFDIILADGKAIFQNVPAGLGMPETLAQVDCDDLAGQ